MQDADAQHDQTTSMLKASTASMASPSRLKPGMKQGSPRPDSRPAAAAAKTTSVAAVATAQEDCMQTANTQAASKLAPKPAPASKRQRTAANNRKGPAGRKAATESEPESEASAGDSDADEPHAAAAASAAAEAARFTPDEVTEVNTSLLKWFDRVMRILPWRRNPHHKPEQQQQQQAAPAAAAASAAAAACGSSGSSSKKPKKPSKAELAVAEAAAVVAAAKPAPADLSPQQFAYYVWVSEIMLQQTQVARVITYFNKWIAAWPTVQDLAQATQEQVNEVWAGLGYYRRARYLLEGAIHIVDKLGGAFPETAAGMRQIPGVGPYTAAAVASIAFNDPAAAVDGNVIRVVSRLRAVGGNPTKLAKTWDRLAGQLLHGERPGCHNQAMMELGAIVCKPVSPLCEACPVSSCCAAYKQVRAYAEAGGSPDVEDAPRVTDYPEKVAKAAKHEQHVAVCVLKVLLLPGVNTPAELEAAAAAAAAAAAGSSGGGSGAAAGSKKQKRSAAASAGGSKQGKINALFRPAAKPAAAGGANAAAGQQQQQQAELCEQDVLAAGGSAHYLLVQRPATGLLAGLWEFPGVITEGELSHKVRRAAAYGYLSNTLGIQAPLQPGTGGAAGKAAAGEADQSAGGGAGVRVLHQRQLGSAVHIFSHIRQTLHAEELVLLAPYLEAVCPTAAAAAGGGAAGAAAADEDKTAAAAAAGTSGGTIGSKQKKRKAGSAGGGDGEGGSGGAAAAAGGGRPSVRWVAAAEISQAGLTSGVRKVLQLSLN